MHSKINQNNWLFLIVVFLSVLPTNYALATELKVLPVRKLKSYLHYDKKHNAIQMKFQRFPLASSSASTWDSPIVPQTFVLTIPHGRVYSSYGYVIVNKKYLIKELIWPWSEIIKGKKRLDSDKLGAVKYIKGRVVILTQEGHRNYYHWITEILPKLALLQGRDYDFIYLPKLTAKFQRQTLELLGVNFNKIIEAEENTYIQADQLIIPSFVSKSCTTPQWVVEYLRSSFIHSISGTQTKKKFASKVFISRQKASYRRVINEDEVFSLFKKIGFNRYNLEDLSVLEQIQLFQQAESVVAFHGAGLTNLIFMNPGTQLIELFQHHEDDTYCYLSQTAGIKYHAIKTTIFKKNGGYTDTIVPIETIKQLIKERFNAY